MDQLKQELQQKEEELNQLDPKNKTHPLFQDLKKMEQEKDDLNKQIKKLESEKDGILKGRNPIDLVDPREMKLFDEISHSLRSKEDALVPILTDISLIKQQIEKTKEETRKRIEELKSQIKILEPKGLISLSLSLSLFSFSKKNMFVIPTENLFVFNS